MVDKNSQKETVILALCGVSPKAGPFIGSEVPFPTCSITEAIKDIDDSISYHSQFTAGSFVTKKEKIQLEKGIEINDDNTNFLDTGLNAEDDFFVASPKFDAD